MSTGGRLCSKRSLSPCAALELWDLCAEHLPAALVDPDHSPRRTLALRIRTTPYGDPHDAVTGCDRVWRATNLDRGQRPIGAQVNPGDRAVARVGDPES